jgi:dihydrofolate reductase
MRALKVFESISIDGFFCDARGDMSFAHAVAPDPEFAAWVSGNASGGGELLLGRKTFEMMESFWTSAAAAEQMPEVARGMNAARKHVATSAATPTWNNSHRLTGPLVDAVRALKQSSGPGITILGSGSLVRALTAAGLVDEIKLVVVPVALGGGRTLFDARVPLRLVSHRAFANGNVVLTYAPLGG